MRINIKEKEYFLEVFKDYFNQSFDFPINGISIDSRNIKFIHLGYMLARYIITFQN